MDKLICQGCGYPLRPWLDGFVIDLEHDRFDQLRPELDGVPRLDGRIYCPPDPYAIHHAGHMPARRMPSQPEEPPMNKRPLAADHWRVISYLYQPFETKRLTGATVSSVMRKQVVDLDTIITVIDLGYAEARLAGQPLNADAVKRLALAPRQAASKVRLRITPAGSTRAGTDPLHLTLCTLLICDRSLNFLLQHAPVTFDQLCDMADRGLIETRLTDGGADIAIDDVRECPEIAYARQTSRGRTFVAYF
ncbi:hypothetical protein [Actinoplanes sp. HUAS TT8]|uniref:hypothetical protein n=1 Tax=Actinoplanes sp. HUAS TT8 TaxID=3447453 RepID=UPI003F521F76